MNQRVNDAFAVVANDELIQSLQKRYKAKYLCRRCFQLRLPKPGEMPTHCGNCSSSDIDVETDFRSQRLEVIRAGGTEAYRELLRKAPPL